MRCENRVPPPASAVIDRVRGAPRKIYDESVVPGLTRVIHASLSATGTDAWICGVKPGNDDGKKAYSPPTGPLEDLMSATDTRPAKAASGTHACLLGR